MTLTARQTWVMVLKLAAGSLATALESLHKLCPASEALHFVRTDTRTLCLKCLCEGPSRYVLRICAAGAHTKGMADEAGKGERRWGSTYSTQYKVLFQRAVKTRRFEALSTRDFVQFLTVAILAGAWHRISSVVLMTGSTCPGGLVSTDCDDIHSEDAVHVVPALSSTKRRHHTAYAQPDSNIAKQCMIARCLD